MGLKKWGRGTKIGSQKWKLAVMFCSYNTKKMGHRNSPTSEARRPRHHVTSETNHTRTNAKAHVLEVGSEKYLWDGGEQGFMRAPPAPHSSGGGPFSLRMKRLHANDGKARSPMRSPYLNPKSLGVQSV